MILSNGFQFPKRRNIKAGTKRLNRGDGSPLQRSLIDFVPEDDFNNWEKTVAWYLDDHHKLFFWYRNIPKQDYAIQGWRKNKVYPDFIFTTADEHHKGSFDKVYVVETKGEHLQGEDTSYKKALFELCNRTAQPFSLADVSRALRGKKIRFEWVSQAAWQTQLNALLA
jgi:type III restriction enzyme